MDEQYFAYRAFGDRASTAEMTMNSDPGTGQVPYIHPVGDVITFDSPEMRDAYVAKRVVITTLEGGRDRKFHWVTAITAEEAEEFAAACAAGPTCLHQSNARAGRVRIPEE